MSISNIAARGDFRPSTGIAAAGAGTGGVTAQLADPAAWDAAIAGFDGVVQEQLISFAANRWPALRLDPVLFSHAGAVVGGALIMVQPLPLGLGVVAISKWGPMLKDAGRRDADFLYRAMLDALITEYADRQRALISILPRPLYDRGAFEHAILAERGFKPGVRMAHPDRYVVNLTIDEAEQRKSLAQKWRYNLNKSEKAGLSFEHAGAEGLAEFDRLYRAMTDRKRFPDHSAYRTMPALLEGAEASRPQLFFVRHGAEIVAGAVIFTAGAHAEYLYGATTDAALPLRAGYFMHWHIIGWLRENTRASWYDLGGTEGFQGLHQFKRGLVGDAGAVAPIPAAVTYVSHWRPRLAGEAALAARDRMQAMRRSLVQWHVARRPQGSGQ